MERSGLSGEYRAKSGSGQNHEVAVIGAGIVGVCCALELQDAGFDVCLVDRKGVGAECSSGNAGHVAVEHIFPLISPETLLSLPSLLFGSRAALHLPIAYLHQIAPWLLRFAWSARPTQVRRTTQAISALNALSLPAYRDLDARFGLSGMLKEQGTLMVFERERSMRLAERDRELLSEHNIETTIIQGNGLHEFDTALNQQLAGGIFFPGSAHVTDPAGFTNLLFTHFMQRGGQMIQACADEIVTEGKHISIKTDSVRLSCRKLVIAAGAWSHKLLKQLGASLPLETERGYHLMAKSPSARPVVPTTHADRRIVATPMQQGLRIAGKVELGGLKLPPREMLAQGLLKHARALLPDLEAIAFEPWMGFRPTLPDSLPAIGPLPGQENVFCAFGHHHLGLTHGAATGQLVCDMIKGNAPPIDMLPYQPGRFLR